MPSSLFARKPLDALLAEVQGEDRLHRVLGPVQLTALGVGAIIGAGIFVTTGAIAKDVAGPALMLSYLVAGLACVFAALCYSEFAAMVPVAGSAYTYAYATLGEFFAWIIGWDLVLEYAVGAATVANGWSGYLQSALGSFGITLPTAISRPGGQLRPGARAAGRDWVVHQPAGGAHRGAGDSGPGARDPGERRPERRDGDDQGGSGALRHRSRGLLREPGELAPLRAVRSDRLERLRTHAAGADRPWRKTARHDGGRGAGLLRLHRLRLGLDARGGVAQPAAGRADRNHRLADPLHAAVPGSGGGADGDGAVQRAGHQRAGGGGLRAGRAGVGALPPGGSGGGGDHLGAPSDDAEPAAHPARDGAGRSAARQASSETCTRGSGPPGSRPWRRESSWERWPPSCRSRCCFPW